MNSCPLAACGSQALPGQAGQAPSYQKLQGVHNITGDNTNNLITGPCLKALIWLACHPFDIPIKS